MARIITVLTDSPKIKIYNPDQNNVRIYNTGNTVSRYNDIHSIQTVKIIEAGRQGPRGISFPQNTLYSYSTPIICQSNSVTSIITIATASYDGAFYEYMAISGSNRRCGTINSIWDNAGNVSFTEISSSNIGNTEGVSFNVQLTGSYSYLKVSVPTNNWIVKSLYRAF